MAFNAVVYGKPVLYLNGDSHIYRSDNPLQQSSTCYTESDPCPRRRLWPPPRTRGSSIRSTTRRTPTGLSYTARRSRWSGSS